MSDDPRISVVDVAPSFEYESSRFYCPHCEQRLPIDTKTECDNCGAHLALLTMTLAPPLTESDSNE